jgi:CMP-N-acetylneuraminic acid synthetase
MLLKKNKLKIKKNFCFAIIPARKGSKGLKNKHLKKLVSEKLIERTFKTANACKNIDLLILSTNDKKIFNLAKKFKIKTPFLRPDSISKDNSASYQYVDHALDWFFKKYFFYPEYIMILQPTNPMRNSQDIFRAIKYAKKNSYESVVSATLPFQEPSECFYIKNNHINFIKIPSVRNNFSKDSRQAKLKCYFLDGNIFIFKTKFFFKKKYFYDKFSKIIFLKKYKGIDINDKYDLEIAKNLLKKYI